MLGTTAEMLEVRHMELAQGRFLPEGDPRHAQPVCVIGTKVASELFGTRPALGEWLRIGDRRFRVIGLLAAQGQSLGFNTDELVLVPSGGGVFEVTINGDLVWSKKQTKRFPEYSEIEEALAS